MYDLLLATPSQVIRNLRHSDEEPETETHEERVSPRVDL